MKFPFVIHHHKSTSNGFALTVVWQKIMFSALVMKKEETINLTNKKMYFKRFDKKYTTHSGIFVNHKIKTLILSL